MLNEKSWPAQSLGLELAQDGSLGLWAAVDFWLEPLFRYRTAQKASD